MFRVANKVYTGDINRFDGDDARGLSARFAANTSDEDILALKNAELLEELDSDGVTVIASYHLTGWRRVEVILGGIKILWDTISNQEVDELKAQMQDIQDENERLRQDNEDLTAALIELAEIIGNIEEE